MIVSGFRVALDFDTYPLSNLIRPRCAERAKPGRGKSVLIMHIGFFHAQLCSMTDRNGHVSVLHACNMLKSLSVIQEAV